MLSPPLFPPLQCQRCAAELSNWCTVANCLAAARILEGRSRSEDEPATVLLVPYPDNDAFEAVFRELIELFASSFGIPPMKLALSRLIDPDIQEETIQRLLQLTAGFSIEMASAGTVEGFPSERLFAVKGRPEVIEVIQNPLRCLQDLTHLLWPTAEKLGNYEKERSPGSVPNFHQPNTDGPLPAFVEALIFQVHGLGVIDPTAPLRANGIYRGYRSFEVVGRPPVDALGLEAAGEFLLSLFDELAND